MLKVRPSSGVCWFINPSTVVRSCYIALFNPTVNQVISYIKLYNVVIYFVYIYI